MSAKNRKTPARFAAAAFSAILLQACSPDAPPAPPPAPAAVAVPVVQGDVAFVDVNVISMQSESVDHDLTVVVRDGVITHIAPAADLALDDSITKIDGKGRFLMPALTDMHDHVQGPETLKLQLAYGVTTVRNMWGTPEILALRDAVASGSIAGPEIITGSPLIDDDPPYFKGSATLTRPEDADAFVAEQKAQGYAFLKPYELLKPDVYEAMMVAADKYGMRVEGHIPQAVDPVRAVELGQDTIEHSMRIEAAILADGIPWGGSFRSREMVDLVTRINAGELAYEDAFLREKLREYSRLMVANGTAVVPTMGVVRARAWSDADRQRMAAHPLLKYVPPMVRPFWLQPWDESVAQEMISRGVMASLSEDEIASLLHYSTVEYGQWVRIMADEGVLLLGGVDAPNSGMFYGYSLHEELQHFVELAGFTPLQAIRTVTVNPARHWGLHESRGIVAAGAEADLLLLTADPLLDVTNTLAIEGVMADGKWYDRNELDLMLQSVEAAYREAGESMN